MFAKLPVLSFLTVIAVAACVVASIVWLRQIRAPERFISAAYEGDFETVRFYLRNGIQPTVQDGWGGTALMYASGQGHVKIVRELLEAGVDVNERSRMDRTPLMSAALGGQYEVAKLLLDCGAETSLVDDEGLTAANIAHEYGHDSIRLLIEERSDTTRAKKPKRSGI